MQPLLKDPGKHKKPKYPSLIGALSLSKPTTLTVTIVAKEFGIETPSSENQQIWNYGANREI